MLNIVLFGPPGSGKGTQSLNIVNKYNLMHISTGDILREGIKNMTPVGLKAKAYLDKGELVPDDVVIDVLMEKAMTQNNVKGFVFDGFPRTINQASMLDEILNFKNIPVNLVLAIDVEEQELYKRIIGRSLESSRTDDNEAVIKNRLDVYKNQTLPIFNYYDKQKKLKKINGMASIEKVFSDIIDSLEEYIKNTKN